ncbi:MAG: hypothetical protein GY820_15700 [Gammaproteobacteria bacterium]|nr:hypothetical protein [Gammaproteobacteria bacterium]
MGRKLLDTEIPNLKRRCSSLIGLIEKEENTPYIFVVGYIQGSSKSVGRNLSYVRQTFCPSRPKKGHFSYWPQNLSTNSSWDRSVTIGNGGVMYGLPIKLPFAPYFSNGGSGIRRILAIAGPIELFPVPIESFTGPNCAVRRTELTDKKVTATMAASELFIAEPKWSDHLLLFRTCYH